MPGWAFAPRSTDASGGSIPIPPSLTDITRALRAAIPERPLLGLEVVDVGFGSVVIETSDGIIIRVGRTPSAARGYAIEAAVLPALAPLLPTVIPVPEFFCRPATQLPFGAIGYQRLPGRTCQPHTANETTGRGLGAFLAALHGLDASQLPLLPGPEEVWQQWHELREDTEAVLRRWLTVREKQRLRRWWDRFLSDRRMRHYQPAVRHGDLWYGNLLVQPDGSISAVIDWEMIAFADPAQDLALSRYLGSSFIGIVIDAYRNRGGTYDDETRYRIDRYWELRELTGVPLAAAVDDEDEIGECVSKLRAGPILS